MKVTTAIFGAGWNNEVVDVGRGSIITIGKGVVVCSVVSAPVGNGAESAHYGYITEEPAEFIKTDSGAVLQPAPPKPEMGWVDVTKECVAELQITGDGWIMLTHKETFVLSLGGGYIPLISHPEYQVSARGQGPESCGGFKVEHWQELV